MKRIVLLLITFLFIIQLSIKPIKSFSNINTSETIGIKYTIWDDEYEEKSKTTKIIYYSISAIVVGVISYLIMNRLKKSMGDTKPVEKKTPIINAVEDLKAEDIYTYFNNENVSQLKEKLFLRFVDYKTSYMNFEYEKIKSISEVNFYNKTLTELNALMKSGYTNISHTFVSENIKIGNIHEEGNLLVIEMYLLVNYYDYVEDQSKNVVAGRKLESVEECFKIEYIITKNKDNIICLNCGKKVFLEKDGVCPYCGTPVKVEATDYLIRNITKY